MPTNNDYLNVPPGVTKHTVSNDDMKKLHDYYNISCTSEGTSPKCAFTRLAVMYLLHSAHNKHQSHTQVKDEVKSTRKWMGGTTGKLLLLFGIQPNNRGGNDIQRKYYFGETFWSIVREANKLDDVITMLRTMITSTDSDSRTLGKLGMADARTITNNNTHTIIIGGDIGGQVNMVWNRAIESPH
jgi:hypothetical protein